jgi:hypothetical protein
MNAGPKTACGSKRPSTGVFAQPFAGGFWNVLVPVKACHGKKHGLEVGA